MKKTTEIIDDNGRAIDSSNEDRRKQLKRLIQLKPLVRVLEAHDAPSGLIVETTKISINNHIREYDAMWLSSLTNSLVQGKPDTECLDLNSRINTIKNIFVVTTKPMIFDGDTGGHQDHFALMVRTLESLGVSAVIIEDKIHPKKNSLYGTAVKQAQDSIENFSRKIMAGKQAQLTDDFMIFARIESLILEKSLKDSLKRAQAYIEAEADGILIHSGKENAVEVLEFCKEYNQFRSKVPLVSIPTTYCQTSEQELEAAGVRIVIYANQLFRSAYSSMLRTAELILLHRRSYEASQNCMSGSELLNLIPGGE